MNRKYMIFLLSQQLAHLNNRYSGFARQASIEDARLVFRLDNALA